MSFRLSAVCFFVFVAISFAHATSVVATLGLNRIILAADTREHVLESGLSQDSHRYRDVRCKLAPPGRTAVAVAGNVKYIRNDPNDSVPDWDALEDAKAAYAVHELDLHEMAADWAHRSELQYARFYAVAPLRVTQLASVNAEHVLVDAVVVGWQGLTSPSFCTTASERVYITTSSGIDANGGSQGAVGDRRAAICGANAAGAGGL
jgi:hypothetical protein